MKNVVLETGHEEFNYTSIQPTLVHVWLHVKPWGIWDVPFLLLMKLYSFNEKKNGKKKEK